MSYPIAPGGLAGLQAAMPPGRRATTMVNFHGHAGDATDRARAWPPEFKEL